MRTIPTLSRVLALVIAAPLLACPGGGKATAPTPTSTPTPVQPETPVAETPTGPPVKQVSMAEMGLDETSMDPKADPCEDFFQYACGGWLAKTEIPADRSGYGTFTAIDERNQNVEKQILEDAVAKPGDDTAKRLGAFYGACMDEAAVEKAGLKPLAPVLKKVDGVKDKKSLVGAIIELHQAGLWVVFQLDGDLDPKDSTRVVAQMGQAGLGLPDRDYYLSDDPHMKEIREQYQQHVERLLTLAGTKPALAKTQAADVMEVETALAKIAMDKVERRDPDKTYHKLALADLPAAAPGFEWAAYTKALGVPAGGDVIVESTDYLKGAAGLIGTMSPVKWKSYLRWQVLHAAAPHLAKAFVDENFTLTQLLSGQAQVEDRWKRCARTTDALLGDDLAQAFIAVAFPGDSKDKASALVQSIKQQFADNLKNVDWMDDATRAAAKTKLDKMNFKIGYPVKWKKYDFAISKDTYLANVMAGRKWRTAWRLGRIGKPVDPDEWGMTPPTVNAYYDPTRNEMVFPAGILQPPFYSAKAAIAVNAGGIGMVMGHELTHGFDDEGSKFDGDGNLEAWWSDAQRKKFEERTQCVVAKYAAYEVLPGLKLNGALTLGENIADLGGVKLAYNAYKSLRAGAPETYQANGLSEDQLFFVAVGQAWCSKFQEAGVRQRVTVDPHSAPHWRVNGSLSNFPEFQRAFKCKAGQKMVPAQVCKVW
jgi:putative endopeptidase